MQIVKLMMTTSFIAPWGFLHRLPSSFPPRMGPSDHPKALIIPLKLSKILQGELCNSILVFIENYFYHFLLHKMNHLEVTGFFNNSMHFVVML